jgi:hypothetical protein
MPNLSPALVPIPLRQIGLLLCFTMFTVQSCLAKDPPLAALSPEHFRDTATVKDDPILGVTTISTEKGYVERHGLLGTVWNDEYLTGTIDRKTARRSFEVIATLTYRGTRRAYGRAKIQGPEGPVVAPTAVLKTSTVNCPTGECTYTDQVSFPLDESLLRMLAAKTPGATPQIWHYTLAAKPGAYAGELSSAEIAGFLARFDQYTGAAPRAMPSAAAGPELGIGGLHVEAGAQMPARGGVLVTAVSPGSLAEKAGLIVGDIVREIDGHPIDAVPDLQTAMAAAAPNAALVIKVYRGTTSMTLSVQP